MALRRAVGGRLSVCMAHPVDWFIRLALGGCRGMSQIGGMKVFLDFEASSLSDQSHPVDAA